MEVLFVPGGPSLEIHEPSFNGWKETASDEIEVDETFEVSSDDFEWDDPDEDDDWDDDEDDDEDEGLDDDDDY